METRAEKLKQAGIERYGSEEAYKRELRLRGSKGGRVPRSVPTGFAAMPAEKLREVSRQGGLKRAENKAV